MAGDYCVFKFLRRGVNRKRLVCFQSKNSVLKFRSGALRRGPKAGRFVHTSSHTQKEKKLQLRRVLIFCNTLKALWTDKKRHWIYVGNELRENRFVLHLFLHAFYKSAEMIKCFAIVVDIVAGYGGYWNFYSQIFDEFWNLIIIFTTKWANAINAVSTTSSGCHC